jgi:hypothetical protein
MRAVIDTGVLVNALIRRQGTTGEVLHALRDGRFTAVYTPVFATKLHRDNPDIFKGGAADLKDFGQIGLMRHV